MAGSGKRYKASLEKVDRAKRYDVEEAFTILKAFKAAKFNESVDVAIRLGVDPKQSDQMVRGVVRMPHGTGKKVRILVFAKGDKEQEAKDAGADFVGSEDLVEKIKGGWLDFDKAIATPDMMAKIGPVAKILGPRGLMPNPKVGTVTKDIAKAVGDQKAGSVEFRVEKAGIIHAPIGRLSFEAAQLKENFLTLLEQVVRAKPPSAKGIYLQSISIASTMSPGVKIDPSKATAAAAKTA
ncbi:MAG: 50S ribosomal protein L1 [Deltaproteobacteria bacterium]|nr:50S ribosomal protein L1 [Deltaproteobacteria bacterium]